MSTGSAEMDWRSAEQLKLHWPDWLVRELIPKDSTICLYGARGMGKSFVALDLALSIATGTDWNGLEVYPGRVAYLMAERPEGLKRRILGWARHRNFLEPELYQKLGQPGHGFFASGATLALDRAKERNELIRHLKGLGGVDLVILDPLISYASGSENDARDMQNVVNGARELVDTCGCSLLLVHHAGKASDEWDRGARGSSALEAAMDTVIALKGRGGQPHLEVTKQREHPQLDRMKFNFRSIIDEEERELGKFPIRANSNAKIETGSLRENKKTRQDRILTETIMKLCTTMKQTWVPFTAIAKHAIDNGIGVQKNSIRIYLNQMVEEQRLLCQRQGTNKSYAFVDQVSVKKPSPPPDAIF